MADLELEIGINTGPAEAKVNALIQSLAQIEAKVQAAGRTVGGGSSGQQVDQTTASVRRLSEAQKELGRSAKSAEDANWKLLKMLSPDQFNQRRAALEQMRVTARQAYTEGQIGWAQLQQANRNYEKGLDNLYGLTSRMTRSPLHQFLAKTASLTFELTGAFYGMATAFAIITGPAAFGVKLLKNMEDMKLATASILINFGQINGKALEFGQAQQVSSEMMKRLAGDAVKFALPLEAVTDTFRSILASGTAAGLTLDQVRQIATLGTIAVRTIGLDSKQAVQEVRDLVAGGIQAASSTLANALGITDSMVKKWKEAGVLAAELTQRMGGFGIAAAERLNTLGGAWDSLITKVQYAFADERIFEGLKRAIQSVSDSIATIDAEGKLQFKQEFINSVAQYTNWIVRLGRSLVDLARFVSDHYDGIKKLAEVYISWKIAIGPLAGLIDTVGLALSRFAAGGAVVALTAMGSKSPGGLVGFALFGFGIEGVRWITTKLMEITGIADQVSVAIGNKLGRVFAWIEGSQTTAAFERVKRITELESGLKVSNKGLTTREFFGEGRQAALLELSQLRAEQQIYANQFKPQGPSIKPEDVTAKPPTTDKFLEGFSLYKKNTTYQIEEVNRQLEIERGKLKEAKNLYGENSKEYQDIYKRVQQGEIVAAEQIASLQRQGMPRGVGAKAKATRIEPDVTSITNKIQDLQGANERLRKEIEDMNEGALRPQAHLFADIKAQIEAGEWANASQKQKDFALSLAKTNDELNNQKEAVEKSNKAMQAAKGIIAELQAATDQYESTVESSRANRELELRTAGRPSVEQDIVRAQFNFEQDQLQAQKTLERRLREEAIAGDPRRIAEVRTEFEKQRQMREQLLARDIASIEHYYETINSLEYQATQASYTIREGLTSAFEEAYVNIFSKSQSFGDAMVALFQNIADMIIQQIGRIMAQQAVNALFGVGTTAAGGAMGGGLLGMLFKGVGGSWMDVSGMFGGGRASGGSVYSGGSYLVGERGPELFVPRGAGTVVPNMGTNIQIIDQRSGSAPPIEATRSVGPNGQEQITVLVRKEVDRYFSSGYADKMQNMNYGIRRPGMQR